MVEICGVSQQGSSLKVAVVHHVFVNKEAG